MTEIVDAGHSRRNKQCKQLGDNFDFKGPDELKKHWRDEFRIYTKLGKMFKGEK